MAKSGQETGIGTVKLPQRTSADDKPIAVGTRTELPRSFSELEGSFVSLDQDNYYYNAIDRYPASLLYTPVSSVLGDRDDEHYRLVPTEEPWRLLEGAPSGACAIRTKEKACQKG